MCTLSAVADLLVPRYGGDDRRYSFCVLTAECEDRVGLDGWYREEVNIVVNTVDCRDTSYIQSNKRQY